MLGVSADIYGDKLQQRANAGRGKRLDALATGQARRMSLVAYAIALVFFLQFFEIFPFSG